MLHESSSDAEALVGEGRRLKDDAAVIAEAATNLALFPRFRSFARYVGERERPGDEIAPFEAALSVFRLLEEHSLFSCGDEDDDDAPL